MRALKLTSIRKASWLPILAVAMAFTLVAGQIFTCCRLNESFSAGIANAFKTLSHSRGQEGASKTISGHPGCHGHGKAATSKIMSPRDFGPGAHLESDEACLSEVAITSKALQPNPPDFSGLFLETPVLLLAAPIALESRFEQPKPQNKSSPPLYLLTLRLLV